MTNLFTSGLQILMVLLRASPINFLNRKICIYSPCKIVKCKNSSNVSTSREIEREREREVNVPKYCERGVGGCQSIVDDHKYPLAFRLFG
jgi:hypothetical protein